MITTASIGRIAATHQDLIMHQRVRFARPNPVIYLNSATSWPYELTVAGFGMNPIAQSIVNNGFVLIAPDAHLHWGNATGRTRVNEALTYAASEFGATAAPIILGPSHGSTSTLMYALDGATDPACILTFLTIVNLSNARTVNGGTLAGGIDAAWPGGVPDIVARASEISSIPVYMHYASDDNLSPNVTNFATNHGNTTLDNVGALGHTDAAMLAANTNNILAFIENAV